MSKYVILSETLDLSQKALAVHKGEIKPELFPHASAHIDQYLSLDLSQRQFTKVK